MTSIPLFVSASGTLAVLAMVFAGGLTVLSAQYSRPYMRPWRNMWIALAAYAFASGGALMAVNLGVPWPWRGMLGAVAIGAAAWHLHSLSVGVRLFAARPMQPWLTIRWGVTVLLAAAFVLVLLPPSLSSAWRGPLTPYLLRMSLLSLAWGLSYGLNGVIMLRSESASPLGRRALGGALVAYGVLRLAEPLLHFVPRNLVLEQFLTYGGIPLLVTIAAGMLIALLEAERSAAVKETAARWTAEQTVSASEALLAQREAWFRAMIEHSSDVILQIAPDGTIEYASPSVRLVLGQLADELPGQNGFGWVHPEDETLLRDAVMRSLGRDASLPSPIPFRARTPGGEYIQMEAVARPFTEADGREHLIIAARDVRERHRLESALVAARRMESLGRLAGSVAHDFNNLLTAMLGNLTLMRSNPAAQAFADNIGEAEAVVNRGAELTRRLLAFARRQSVEPRVLKLWQQVVEMTPLLERLLGETVALDVRLGDELWPVRIDPLALEQIIVNLAVNARDAMPSGGTLRISGSNLTIGSAGHLHLDLAPGQWVRLDVTDEGVGIAPDILPHIFEPFFTTKGEIGTGLGLSIVHGAASQAGGHAHVESTSHGTTFSIFFPRAEAPVIAPAPHAPQAVPRAQQGETILLIEDESSVRDVTAKLLGKLGYHVLTAVDGQDGVDRSREYHGNIDLVVSDLMMPRKGGVEAVKEIRERRANLPVLFISGYSEQVMRSGQKLPAGGRLLPKPYAVDELAAAVRGALDAAPT